MDEDFKKLKITFITAQILKHHVPKLLFMVEVEDCDVGVGAILTNKLLPAERYYDIDNRE